MLSGCSAIVSGELPSQRPTLVSAGKNRPLGSRRSAHSPFAWRSWSANPCSVGEALRGDAHLDRAVRAVGGRCSGERQGEQERCC